MTERDPTITGEPATRIDQASAAAARAAVGSVVEQASGQDDYEAWIRESGEMVHFMDDDEAREFFDQAAQDALHMPGEEFVTAWREGKFRGTERSEVISLSLLLPFAEQQS